MDAFKQFLAPPGTLDMENLAETELERLLRQYRIMEGDRKSFMEMTNIKLEKQRKIIKTLKKEQESLLIDINIANCKTRQKNDAILGQKINKLYYEYEDNCEKLSKDKTNLKELDSQIKKLDRQVTELRAKEITENDYKFRIQSGKKNIETLENRLSTTIKRFCSVLTKNKEHRNDIDHLIIERGTFNEIFDKLITDLNNGKKFLLEMVEQATVAFDQREDLCSKLHALKIRAENENSLHAQDMREIQRILDNYSKLKDFFAIKGQKRIMKDLERKEIAKKQQEKEKYEKEIESCHDTLEQIKDFCKETDINKISAQFLKEEEENFALFNYVNELNTELESLNETIMELDQNIEEQKIIRDETSTEQNKSLETYKIILANSTKSLEKERLEMEKAQKNLEIVLQSVLDIFNLLKCDKVPLLKLLGSNSEISSHNVKVYVGLIEKQVTELITKIFFQEKSLKKN